VEFTSQARAIRARVGAPRRALSKQSSAEETSVGKLENESSAATLGAARAVGTGDERGDAGQNWT
jgi:hypothetical protein